MEVPAGPDCGLLSGLASEAIRVYVDGHLKGKSLKAFEGIYGYPRLALVKTLFFCQCNVVASIGQSVTWTAGLSLVLSCT